MSTPESTHLRAHAVGDRVRVKLEGGWRPKAGECGVVEAALPDGGVVVRFPDLWHQGRPLRYALTFRPDELEAARD